MAVSSGHNIEAFLSTVNLDGKTLNVAAPDPEVLGKLVLNVLSDHGEATLDELTRILQWAPEQVSRAVEFLNSHEMTTSEPINNTHLVRLTPFAKSAMGVFSVR